MSSKKTYTAAEVHNLLSSLLDGLAESQLIVEQATLEDSLEENSKLFALGQASGLETAEDLITETLEELGKYET